MPQPRQITSWLAVPQIQTQTHRIARTSTQKSPETGEHTECLTGDRRPERLVPVYISKYMPHSLENQQCGGVRGRSPRLKAFILC